jgi:aspartyl protease family protein
LIGFAVLGALLPGSLAASDALRAIPLGVFLILMVARLAASTAPLGPMARQFALLLAFGAVLVIGYSYRIELGGIVDRATGTILPSHGTEIAPGMVRFMADDRGQFSIDATVDGSAVHFLMDTGASGIVLSARDASRLG